MFRRTADEKRVEFEEVALVHSDALFNFALKMTRNRKDAEDLVQDTYLRAYRFFDNFEKGTNCRAWLFRILKNTFINNYRKVQRTPDMVDWDQVEEFYDTVATGEHTAGKKTPEDEVIENTIDPRIEEAVRALPDEYRSVIVLNFMEDLSYKEIAAVLEIPMGTVMSRLHRARKILQRKLKDQALESGIVDDDPGDGGDVVKISSYRKTGDAS